MVNTDLHRKLEKIRLLVGEHQRLAHINVMLQLQHIQAKAINRSLKTTNARLTGEVLRLIQQRSDTARQLKKYLSDN